MTHDEIVALVRHAPYDKIRLWIKLLHDTGLDALSILSFQRTDIRAFGRIRCIYYVMVDRSRDAGIGLFDRNGSDICMAPIRPSTAKALLAHDRANLYEDRLFFGRIADLAMELVRGIRLAALRAGIRRKDVHPRVFRRMKLRAFCEAGVGEDVIGNALGLKGVDGRRPEETLEEAAGVLGKEPSVFRRLWKKVWKCLYEEV